MSSHSQSGTSIKKNALYLYAQALFSILLSLYTSRLILQNLGVNDFGIYNVTGGVVLLFTFISQAMATATQRHLSVELGMLNGNTQTIFSACLQIHAIMATVVLLFAETIGLWFLNTQMSIPAERLEAANWVYQFSIFSCFISIISTPYNAAIVAYEKMQFLSLLGVVEACLKLAIVFALAYCVLDKLILYSILLFTVTLAVAVMKWYYSNRHFSETQYIIVKNKELHVKLIAFSGWTLFGSLANISSQHGVNLIVNMFYGVGVNAAVALANQVNVAVSQFIGGIQQASNPQIVKSEASGDIERLSSLVCTSAKLSFLILWVISIPLILHLEEILTLWLGNYPQFTYEICATVLLASLFEALSGPLWVSIFATGQIRQYQISISIVLLLILPISLLLGNFSHPPYAIFAAKILISLVALTVRLIYLKRLTSFELSIFYKRVLKPILFLIVVTLPLLAIYQLYIKNTLYSTLFSIAISTIAISALTWSIAMSINEKEMFLSLISKIKNK